MLQNLWLIATIFKFFSIYCKKSHVLFNFARNVIIKTMANVKIQTTLGDITVRLYDETPLHRDNFIKLVKEQYYDGTLFHHVMMQAA